MKIKKHKKVGKAKKFNAKAYGKVHAKVFGMAKDKAEERGER